MENTKQRRGFGGRFAGQSNNRRGRGGSNRQARSNVVKQEEEVQNVEVQNQQVPKREEKKEKSGRVNTQPLSNEIKKVNLEEYFMDYLEEDRKNLLMNIDFGFENVFSRRYENMIEDLCDQHRIGKNITLMKVIFHAAVKIGVASRLLITASNTDKNKDLKMKKFPYEIKQFLFPNAINIMLSNIGKFTDDVFGNARIISPMLIGKHKILDAIKVAYVDGIKDNFQWKDDDLFNKMVSGNLSVGSFIWMDRDMIGFFKFRSLELYNQMKSTEIFEFQWKKSDNTTVKVKATLPDYDFQNSNIESAKTYLDLIDGWSFNFSNAENPWSGYQVNFVVVGLILLSLLNENWIQHPDKKVGQIFDELKSTYAKNITLNEILNYFGYIDANKMMSKDQLINNALYIVEIYSDRLVPLLEFKFKMSDLTASEFGNDSQLIIADEKDWMKRRNENVPGYRAFSKKIPKNNVVMGGLFSYVKEVFFKQNLRSNLKVNRNNVFSELIRADLKYIDKK
jgi:hypothetical protein